EAIDCYKCTSIDGATEECEDKFDIGMSTVHFIQRSCQYGYFKGTHCIKFKGERGKRFFFCQGHVVTS
ncbi:U-scoloptoxin(05)-Sm1a, partial [Biomphalaria glabrata]